MIQKCLVVETFSMKQRPRAPDTLPFTKKDTLVVDLQILPWEHSPLNSCGIRILEDYNPADPCKLFRQILNPMASEAFSNYFAPEPERTGQPYNSRAAETYRILTDLKCGVLTSYPLSISRKPVAPIQPQSRTPMSAPAAPRVFISYSHDADDHRACVLGLS